MSAQPTKKCIWCKQDCSAKPRQKDLKGNYLCKECVEPYQKALTARAKQRRPEHAVPTIPLASDSSVVAGDVLSNMIDQTAGARSESCPSCNRMLSPEAKICTHCGYNKQSGRQMQSRVETLKPEKGESKSLQAASAVADTASFSLLIGTICCCVGGAIGGAIWAGIAFQTGYEIRIISILIGCAVGGGMLMGARGYAGMPTALIAGVVALISVVGSRYIVISYFIDEFVAETGLMYANEHDAMVYLADQTVFLKESQRVDLVWPDGESVETAYYEEDYPAGIWAEAVAQWEALDSADQTTTIARAQAEIDADVAAVKEDGFIASLGLRGIIFMGFSIVIAFVIGGGGSFD